MLFVELNSYINTCILLSCCLNFVDATTMCRRKVQLSSSLFCSEKLRTIRETLLMNRAFNSDYAGVSFQKSNGEIAVTKRHGCALVFLLCWLNVHCMSLGPLQGIQGRPFLGGRYCCQWDEPPFYGDCWTLVKCGVWQKMSWNANENIWKPRFWHKGPMSFWNDTLVLQE